MNLIETQILPNSVVIESVKFGIQLELSNTFQTLKDDDMNNLIRK